MHSGKRVPMEEINLLNPVDASECSGCGVSDFCHSLWSISHDFFAYERC